MKRVRELLVSSGESFDGSDVYLEYSLRPPTNEERYEAEIRRSNVYAKRSEEKIIREYK